MTVYTIPQATPLCTARFEAYLTCTLLPEPIAVAQEPIPCEVLQDLLGYTPHKLNGLLERSKLLLNSSSSGRETSSAANNKMIYESVYLVHKMMYEWLIGE